MKKAAIILVAAMVLIAAPLFAKVKFGSNTTGKTFTPSIAGKLVPELTGMSVCFEKGLAKDQVPTMKEIVVTVMSYSKRGVLATNPRKNLDDAFEDIRTSTAMSLAKEVPALAAERYGKDFDPAKLYVADLFSVTIGQEAEDFIAANKAQRSSKMTFAYTISAGEPAPIILVRDYITGTWSPVEKVVNNNNGTFTAYFNTFGAVAILKVTA